MTEQNQFLWPEQSRLTFSNARGNIYFRSENRNLDLSDALMHTFNYRTVYVSISTPSPRWRAWTEESVQSIEALIKYDLQFDGYRVTILRTDIPSEQYLCTQEFRWKLSIRPA